MSTSTLDKETLGTQQPKGYLSIRNLNKRYPKTDSAAVDDINLDVEKGKLIALLGPSGCGKTTTLRMVAGLLEPTSGHIIVDGQDVVSTPVHKRGMGMVFQSYALFPHMTVAENVAFGLQMQKKPKAKIKELVREGLQMVQLGHLAERKPAELSGGQQQRVALARALVTKPKLLLLDEPLSNLDAKLREAMRHEIKEIQRKSGTTTLFVTHDQDEALDMADKIAILNNGIIEQYDVPQRIYDHPTTRFVANFVGKANFVQVDVVDVGKDGFYTVESPVFGRMDVGGAAHIDRQASVLVVRPHRIALSDMVVDGGSEVGRVTGTIVDAAYTGNVQSYTVELPNGDRIAAEQLTDRPPRWGIGDEVGVAFDPNEAHLVTDG